jgi:DNA ligase D-like protein (predicted 3'-phosphoesterase)
MGPRLQTYRSRRDFSKSPEPSGEEKSSRWKRSGNPIFVVQEHDASTHHFDFRLEVDGALVSWAVPKGPSTDPRDKRLAIRTEDHPLDYADFEGVIPEGEYGAGTVVVWDAGPYRNLGEAAVDEALKEGHLRFWIEGKKLRGGYSLIHAEPGGDEDGWLLVKHDDDAADARRNPVSTEPKSVLSGRTLKEVAHEESERR